MKDSRSEERPYTDENIEPYRLVSDELGDSCLKAMKQLRYTPRSGDSLEFISTALKNPATPSAERAALQAFVDSAYSVPEWVDYEKFEVGRHVYLRFAPLATNVIFLAGLIGSYSASKGVKVLIKTGRLQTDILPRLFETSQMVADVLQEDSLRPDGVAFKTLLRVRLMHCGVRHYILNVRDDWNMQWGHPVNQEDMCGTLTLFSYVVLKGLETMGVFVPNHEKEAYMHMWRYAGYLLGCDEFFLPPTYGETEELYAAVRRRQTNPDEDSRALVHAVIDAVARKYEGVIPKEGFYAMSRYFIGDQLADKLEMPMNKVWSMALHAMIPFWGVSSYLMSNIWLFQKAFSPLGNAYIHRTIENGLGGRKPVFAIPGIAG